MNKHLLIPWLFKKLLSKEAKEKGEAAILKVSIASFVVHLIIIGLVGFGVLDFSKDSKLLTNPIAAIYTPFSFILVYEVYLLVYYLPKSITTYISKQYEIITLIIIRRIFKDLASLELSSEWFQIKDDLQFTYDIVAALLLFFLLYLFYTQSQNSFIEKEEEAVLDKKIVRFIRFKKVIAVLLVPFLLVLAVYTFSTWLIDVVSPGTEGALKDTFKDINNIFFDEFFTTMIIVDVILLLLSLFHTDQFHKVIRNSGFIISTILIRLSFSVEGLVNTLLIISAVLFGLLIVIIHNKYDQKIAAASVKKPCT